MIVCNFVSDSFFYSRSCDHHNLHSFPTRRSADLGRGGGRGGAEGRGAERRRAEERRGEERRGEEGRGEERRGDEGRGVV